MTTALLADPALAAAWRDIGAWVLRERPNDYGRMRVWCPTDPGAAAADEATSLKCTCFFINVPAVAAALGRPRLAAGVLCRDQPGPTTVTGGLCLACRLPRSTRAIFRGLIEVAQDATIVATDAGLSPALGDAPLDPWDGLRLVYRVHSPPHEAEALRLALPPTVAPPPGLMATGRLIVHESHDVFDTLCTTLLARHRDAAADYQYAVVALEDPGAAVTLRGGACVVFVRAWHGEATATVTIRATRPVVVGHVALHGAVARDAVRSLDGLTVRHRVTADSGWFIAVLATEDRELALEVSACALVLARGAVLPWQLDARHGCVDETRRPPLRAPLPPAPPPPLPLQLFADDTLSFVRDLMPSAPPTFNALDVQHFDEGAGTVRLEARLRTSPSTVCVWAEATRAARNLHEPEWSWQPARGRHWLVAAGAQYAYHVAWMPGLSRAVVSEQTMLSEEIRDRLRYLAFDEATPAERLLRAIAALVGGRLGLWVDPDLPLCWSRTSAYYREPAATTPSSLTPSPLSSSWSGW